MTSPSIIAADELGRRIRKLRSDSRLTLKQVENACGLSATHLSEIERGRTSPTIGALVRIARALGKDASYFIELDDRPDVSHVTRECTRTLNPAAGVTAEPLTSGIPGSCIFAYRLTVGGELSMKAQSVEGDALYMVRRGTLETEFGDTRFALGEGDAVQATLTLPHRLRAGAGAPAEVIAILSRSLEEPL